MVACALAVFVATLALRAAGAEAAPDSRPPVVALETVGGFVVHSRRGRVLARPGLRRGWRKGTRTAYGSPAAHPDGTSVAAMRRRAQAQYCLESRPVVDRCALVEEEISDGSERVLHVPPDGLALQSVAWIEDGAALVLFEGRDLTTSMRARGSGAGRWTAS